MSTPTIPGTALLRPDQPSAVISAGGEASSSALDKAAAEIHLALGGEFTEQPADEVLECVREAVRNIRVRRAAGVPTDGMADKYRVMVHPEEYCHRPWCLARVQVDEDTGRAWHNTGVHRRAVRSLEVEYGLVIQVGVGVDDDFELDLDHPFVHVWQADLDENCDYAEQLHLTAEEADRLGDFLKAAARELRSTPASIAENAACKKTEAS
jgi:hypothetical protein